jgi:surface antigen
MKSLLRLWAAALVVVLAAGCAGGPREGVGTVLGGAAGGIAGSHIGKGHGRTAGIIVGTLIGALVGQDIGRVLDDADELRAAHVLEKNRTGQSSSWANPDSGSEVTVVPTRTYQQPSGEYCREYQTEVTIGRRAEKAYGTACRQPDGQWKIVR